MNSSKRRGYKFLMLSMSIPVALLAQPSLGDVNFSRNIEVIAGGPLQTYGSKTVVTTRISGDKSWNETSVTAGGKESGLKKTSIVRLDKAVSWDLDASEQQYKERSLEQLQGELSNLRNTVTRQTKGEALPIDPNNCSWSEAKVSAKKTKEKERIAGIRATRHLLKLSQTCRDEVSHHSCDFEWLFEPWMSKRVKNSEEVTDFYQQFADELSMDYLIPQMSGPSQHLLGLFPNRWEMLLDEMEAFPGYSVRTVMTLRIGGKNCLTAEGEEIAESGLLADAGTGAYNAAIDQSGAQASSAVGTATSEAIGDSVGGTIGGAAVGAATGELLGGVTEMFKKKKNKPKKKARVSAPKMATVFKVSSEVSKWDGRKVEATQFDIPQGWTPAP